MLDKFKVMTIFGTRPEAIKMALVIRALGQSEHFEQVVCATAQHREMLDQVLTLFDITPDYDLNVMRPEQSLYQVTIALLNSLEEVLKAELPDLVLVQGDTTSTFIGALAAYYQRTPVGHVEAGLRSGNKYSPFPEEINRTLTGHIADLHFAPTPAARDALLAEGIQADRVFVTGNTVIDALLYVLERHPQPFTLPGLPPEARLILVTAHRRESFGAPLRSICAALVDLATHYPDVHLVYPVHPNPNVQRTVQVALRGFPHIHLIEPLEYASFCALMRRAALILTDSGGVQEEAPTLGKPVLVMREVTERTEGVEAGTARLVGADRERIVTETSRLLDDPIAYAEMANAVNPYGDGRAADRITNIVAEWLTATAGEPNARTIATS